MAEPNWAVTTAFPASSEPEIEPIVSALRLIAAKGGLPSERALAVQLNVKRHRLRQALGILRANGEFAPAGTRRDSAADARRGEALARDTNPIEVIEMRIALEPSIARLAAVRASPLEIARILKASTTSTGTDSGAADLTFHKMIAASCGNNLAFALYSLLRQIGGDARLRLGSNRPACPKRVVQRDAEHRAIAEAIAVRDPDAAERAMRQHLAKVQQRVLERLAPVVAAE
jgi:GntR family transcriptional regulator, transcriptional repressor for pyruvate dehydrogenase complex